MTKRTQLNDRTVVAMRHAKKFLVGTLPNSVHAVISAQSKENSLLLWLELPLNQKMKTWVWGGATPLRTMERRMRVFRQKFSCSYFC